METKKIYYDNGNIKREYQVNNEGKIHGTYKNYHENGQLKNELKFTNDIQNDGNVVSYHDNGTKSRSVTVINGSFQGEFFEWHANGALSCQGTYEDDEILERTLWDEDGSLKAFDNELIQEAVKQWLVDPAKTEAKYGHISSWDTSKVNNMDSLFELAKDFNDDIGSWDVSKVERMQRMFDGAESFNQDIGGWDVSSVTNMNRMFGGATSFNQPVGVWNVSNVKDMTGMFQDASSFNQDIGSWDVSKVVGMNGMFKGATSFNQDIGGWDVSHVEYIGQMFHEATSFNQDISKWDISYVWSMNEMFDGAISFDQDLSDWLFISHGDAISLNEAVIKIFPNTALSKNKTYKNWNINFVGRTFNNNNIRKAVNDYKINPKEATKTYGDIESWDVSRVTNMSKLFCYAVEFNEDISKWDVGRVTNMDSMFYGASSFNQDIGGWDVGRVTNMKYMFDGASSFNQPIGGWNVSNVKEKYHMFSQAFRFNQSLKSWSIQKDEWEKMFWLATLFNINFSFESQERKPTLIFEGAFKNSTLKPAVDEWILDKTSALKKYGDIGTWDVSKVTNMSSLFDSERFIGRDNDNDNKIPVQQYFNDNISNWDVSRVTNMKYMFRGASSFNQPIGVWNVSNVKDMTGMFQDAPSFNHNINNWNTENLLKAHFLFDGAKSFNKPVNDLNTSKVKDFRGIFRNATSFNQPIGNWDLSKAIKLNKMFYNAKIFNQPINELNFNNVTDMSEMFTNAECFCQDISSWANFFKAKNKNIFKGAKAFMKVYDKKSLSKKNTLSSLDSTQKKQVSRLKKFFLSRDYILIQEGLELIKSINDPKVYEHFLSGIKIDDEGGLIRSSILSGSGPAQPYLDYVIISLINLVPYQEGIDKTIKRLNISKIVLYAKYPETLQVRNPDTERWGIETEDCGSYSTNKFPDFKFENLKEITLVNYSKLESLKFLLNCKKLEKIIIQDCPKIKDKNIFPENILIRKIKK